MKFIRLKNDLLILMGLVILNLIFASFKLDSFPRLMVDEPWEFITGYELATYGTLTNSVLPEIEGNIDVHFLQPRIIQSFILAGVNLFLPPGQYIGRIVSVIFGTAAVALLFWMVGKEFGRRMGFFAAFVLMTDHIFFVSERTIRPEIYLTFFGLLTFYMLFRFFQSGAGRYLFIAGLLNGIGLYLHPNMLIFSISFAVIFYAEGGGKALWSGDLLKFVGYGMIGFTPYLVYVIYQDGGNGYADFLAQITNRVDPLTQGNYLSKVVMAEFERLGDFTAFPKRLLIVTITFIAILFGIRDNNRLYKWSLIIIFTHIFLYFTVISNKTVRYMTVLTPFFSLLIARFFYEILKGDFKTIMKNLQKFQLKETAIILLLGLFTVNQLGAELYIFYRDRECSYSQVVEELRESIPEDATVWASLHYWFAFYDRPFISHYAPVTRILSIKPEYIVMYDYHVWGGTSATLGQPLENSYGYLRETLENLKKERGETVSRLKDTCYGDIEVVKLDWSIKKPIQ